MEQEIFKDIPGYEGKYQISNLGNVKSFNRGKIIILKNHICKSGYLDVQLGKGNKKYIHRLVAVTFINNSNNLSQINHKDGNKQNNSVYNLEWCTPKENMIHARNTGLCKPIYGLIRNNLFINNHPMKGKFGDKNHYSKKIMYIDIYGNKSIFNGLSEAGRFFGLSKSIICHNLKGRTSLKMGGFFKYL